MRKLFTDFEKFKDAVREVLKDEIADKVIQEAARMLKACGELGPRKTEFWITVRRAGANSPALLCRIHDYDFIEDFTVFAADEKPKEVIVAYGSGSTIMKVKCRQYAGKLIALSVRCERGGVGVIELLIYLS